MTKWQVLHISSEVGLDFKGIERDLENPEGITLLARNGTLAKKLGLTAPEFIVGSELPPGALGPLP